MALALNAVVDGGPTDVPHADELARAGIDVLDLSKVYPKDQYAQLRVAPWDDHPNAAAHRLIADEIFRQLTPMIADPIAK